MKTSDIAIDAFRSYFQPVVQVWNLIHKHKVYAYVPTILLFHFLFLVFGSFVMWDWSYMDISLWEPKARVFFIIPWLFGFLFGFELADHLNSLDKLKKR